MSPLQWVLLFVTFTSYVLFGGFVFMVLEQNYEEEVAAEEEENLEALKSQVKETLIDLDSSLYGEWVSDQMIQDVIESKLDLMKKISIKCGIDIIDTKNSSDGGNFNPSDPENKWSYYNSVFFAFTVVTTIGYGHLYPTAKWSKIFMIIYALIGIPLDTIFLSTLSDYFTDHLMSVQKKSKKKKTENNFTLFLQILYYLIPGVIVFLMIPAIILVFLEEWTFLDSFYYTFVTVSTIGFGDLVAGQRDGQAFWLWVYKVLIILWIVFGMGYFLMILGFISKGMTSKKIRVAIEKRLAAITSTRDKLSKDVEFMKRIVNELYMLKVNENYDWDDQEEYIAIKDYNPNRRLSFPGSLAPGYDIVYKWDFEVKTKSLSLSDLYELSSEVEEPSVPELPPETDKLLDQVISILNTDMMGNVKNTMNELKDLESGGQSYFHNERTSLVKDSIEFDTDKKTLLSVPSLDKVVVHKEVNNSAISSPKEHNQRTIRDRVSGVIRKISTVARPTMFSNEPSKKYTETEDKPINELKPQVVVEEEKSHSTSNTSLDQDLRKRKISKEHFFSNVKGGSIDEKKDHILQIDDDNARTRKISQESNNSTKSTEAQKSIENLMTRVRKTSRMEMAQRKISSNSNKQLEAPNLGDLNIQGSNAPPHRKISQSSRASSGSQGPPSRKISRNESFTDSKRISRYNHNLLFPPLNSDGLPGGMDKVGTRSSFSSPGARSRAVSPVMEESRFEATGIRKSPSFVNPERPVIRRGSRRVSDVRLPRIGNPQQLQPSRKPQKKLSDEANNELANLWSALDNVQRQLNQTHKPEASASATTTQQTRRQARRRKIGIFNPGFKYSVEDMKQNETK